MQEHECFWLQCLESRQASCNLHVYLNRTVYLPEYNLMQYVTHARRWVLRGYEIENYSCVNDCLAQKLTEGNCIQK
jgi:hypothetical protein